MCRLARSRTLGWIAAELGLQLDQIGEDVGLAPQLVGGIIGGWLAIVETTVTRTPRRYRLDQRAEIAVAGKQHDLIRSGGVVLFGGIPRR